MCVCFFSVLLVLFRVFYSCYIRTPFKYFLRVLRCWLNSISVCMCGWELLFVLYFHSRYSKNVVLKWNVIAHAGEKIKGNNSLFRNIHKHTNAVRCISTCGEVFEREKKFERNCPIFYGRPMQKVIQISFVFLKQLFTFFSYWFNSKIYCFFLVFQRFCVFLFVK